MLAQHITYFISSILEADNLGKHHIDRGDPMDWTSPFCPCYLFYLCSFCSIIHDSDPSWAFENNECGTSTFCGSLDDPIWINGIVPSNI